MDLRDLLDAVRRRWWLLVLTTVLAAVVGLALGPSGDTVRSTGTLVVGADPTLVGEGARFSAAEEIDRDLIFTWSDITDGGESVAAAAEAAGVDPDEVTVDALPGQESFTVQVTVEGDDPDAVQAMAAAVMDQGSERLLSLYDIFQVQVVDQAAEPTSVGPPTRNVVGVAAVLGLGAGLAVVGVEAAVRRRGAGPAGAADG